MCVCGGAMMMCSFGAAPSSLTITPNTVKTTQVIATIMDFKPNVNIPPFGMCNSPTNPATKRPPPVLFTPAPCVPNTVAPWAPGSSTVTVGNFPALNDSSTLNCLWAGVISINVPGQMTINIP